MVPIPIGINPFHQEADYAHGSFYTETLLYVVSPYQNAIFVRSPTKNCVTSKIIKKVSNHIFFNIKQNYNRNILAFICFNGFKKSRYN